MGILAAVGMARFADRSSFDADAFTDQTRGMLRLAQKTAIAQNRPVYVRLNGSSVALCLSLDCGTVLTATTGSNSGSAVTLNACNHSGSWLCEGVPAGLAMSVTPGSTPITFYFDRLGKPYASGDIDPVLTSNFQTLSIDISGDGAHHPLVVEAETGYVH